MDIIQDEEQRAYVQHNLRTPLTVIKCRYVRAI